MTDSTSDKGVPAKARPTVFHHEGRRLFLIDGEPRIVDVDMGAEAGLKRRREIRDTIAAQLSNIVSFGKVYRVDAADGTASVIETSESGDVCELRLPTAIRDQLYALLEAEGILGVSRPGVKPAVWLLSKDQMLWVVAKSRTAEADALLKELFRVYKAWEDGTLEPVRPVLGPSPSPDGSVPVPAHIAPHRMIGQMDFCHFEGILFSFAGDGWMHVWGGSVAEALGLGEGAFAAELAKWPQLGLLGEMPSLEGRPGVWLKRAHLTFLLSRPGVATEAAWRIAAVMAAQADDRAWVSDGELYLRYPAAVLGPKEGRQCARPGADVPWAGAPCDFLRDGRGLLRIRHDRLAGLWGRDARGVGDEILRRRGDIADGAAKVLERHEVDAEGRSAVGLYLTQPHAARLARLLGLGEGVVRDAFARWEEFDADLMEALAADQRAFAASLPSAAVAASLDALRSELAGLRADLADAGFISGAWRRARSAVLRLAGPRTRH